jgi:Nucleotidyltransferase domain
MAGQISAAFVYGSVAKKIDTAGSDVDLMIVSDRLIYADLFAALEQASAHRTHRQPDHLHAQGPRQAPEGLDHRRRACPSGSGS